MNVCGGPRCKRNKMLKEAIAVQDELDLIGELVNVKITIGSDVTIRDDLIRYCAETICLAWIYGIILWTPPICNRRTEFGPCCVNAQRLMLRARRGRMLRACAVEPPHSE